MTADQPQRPEPRTEAWARAVRIEAAAAAVIVALRAALHGPESVIPARAAERTEIDVERLAKALEAIAAPMRAERFGWGPAGTAREFAATIAAEYRALAADSPAPEAGE